MTGDWRGAMEAIKRTRTQRGRADSGLFCIEGLRLHERALRSGCVPETVLLSESVSSGPCARTVALMHDLRSSSCEVRIAPDAVLKELVGGRGLGDLLGLVQIPERLDLQEFIANEDGKRPVVVAVDIFDPGNCGALVRTALAGGACLFVAVGKTDPYHPKAVQTSMGSLFKIPIVMVEDACEALLAAKHGGAELLGLSCDADLELQTANLGGRQYATVLGSEAFGLPPEVTDMIDTNIRIAMPPGVDSFSVNAAAAIVLYELNR